MITLKQNTRIITCKVVEYIYIAKLPRIMSRPPKSPIPLNDILRRYLEEIEFEHTIRRNDKNIKPFEMFLIFKINEEESYPENLEDSFEIFKEYMSNEKILEFPTISKFAKKYGFKWTDADIMKSIDIDRYNTVEFEKFFPVKVTDFAKLQEFIKKYGKISKTKVTKKISKEITDYNFETKILKKVLKSGEITHNFRSGKNHKWESRTIKIFERLWKKHRQTEPEHYKKGKADSFSTFMSKTGLTTRAGIDKKTIEEYQVIISNVVKTVQRKKFPFSLTCNQNEILLTVND